MESLAIHPSEETVRIAVVLPVYNTRHYLRECLESLRLQNHQNFVVFAVNDGSTDGSDKILNDFSNRDPRFRIFHKLNGGVSSARNLALDAIEAENTFHVITFCDSDDIAKPNYLSLYAHGYKKYRAHCIAVGYRQFNKKGLITENYKFHKPIEIYQEDIYDFAFSIGNFSKVKSPASSSFLNNIAFDAKKIKGIRFDVSMITGEDQAFKIQALANCKKVVAFSDIGFLYRIRKSSLSHNVKSNPSDDFTIYKKNG